MNNVIEADCYTLFDVDELIASKYIAELINN